MLTRQEQFESAEKWKMSLKRDFPQLDESDCELISTELVRQYIKGARALASFINDKAHDEPIVI